MPRNHRGGRAEQVVRTAKTGASQGSQVVRAPRGRQQLSQVACTPWSTGGQLFLRRRATLQFVAKNVAQTGASRRVHPWTAWWNALYVRKLPSPHSPSPKTGLGIHRNFPSFSSCSSASATVRRATAGDCMLPLPPLPLPPTGAPARALPAHKARARGQACEASVGRRGPRTRRRSERAPRGRSRHAGFVARTALPRSP